VEAGKMKKRGKLRTILTRVTRKGRETLRLELEAKIQGLEAKIEKCQSNQAILEARIGTARKEHSAEKMLQPHALGTTVRKTSSKKRFKHNPKAKGFRTRDEAISRLEYRLRVGWEKGPAANRLQKLLDKEEQRLEELNQELKALKKSRKL
jgi:hypothetical protein